MVQNYVTRSCLLLICYKWERFKCVLYFLFQSLETIMMEVRDPLQWHFKQLDHAMGLSFKANFNFALVGHLLKGKNCVHFKNNQQVNNLKYYFIMSKSSFCRNVNTSFWGKYIFIIIFFHISPWRFQLSATDSLGVGRCEIQMCWVFVLPDTKRHLWISSPPSVYQSASKNKIKLLNISQ